MATAYGCHSTKPWESMPTLPPIFRSLLLTTTVLRAVSLKERRPQYRPPTLLVFLRTLLCLVFWALGFWLAPLWVDACHMKQVARADAQSVADLGHLTDGPWQSAQMPALSGHLTDDCALDFRVTSPTAILGMAWPAQMPDVLGTPRKPLLAKKIAGLVRCNLSLPNLDRPSGTQAQRRGEATNDDGGYGE